MEYRKLGSSGLEVSTLCLGGMSFGVDPGTGARGTHAWVLGESESRSIISRALSLGINFIDTANVYSGGSSEEIIGRVVSELGVREELVLATKLRARIGDGPNREGLSRKHIFDEVDSSLRRLGVDYIDLLQIHRADDTTPIEETMEALHDVVKSGKVRYIGSSSMPLWQFAKAQYTAVLNGWTKFVSMQNHYNLLYREEEREMIPFCIDQGIGLIPWSPLARGRLARGLNADTKRAQTDGWDKKLYSDPSDSIVTAVDVLAKDRDIPNARVALRWLLNRPGVISPIIGVTKAEHLDDAVAALDLDLSDEEMSRLEAPYTARDITM